MKLDNKNNLFIFREDDYILNDYIDYCCDLMKEHLSNNDLNIIFGLKDFNYKFNNKNKVYKIGMQVEHTLIIENTPHSYPETAILGNTYYDDHRYLVRIQRLNYLKSLDYVIEYSTMNIANIKTVNKFDDYLNKVICISPLIYEDHYFNADKRDGVITSFIYDNPRRKFLREDICNNNIEYQNINCFNKEELKNIYQNKKILINIHQTFNGHTLEELRVLPALQCGIIVICEDCPLKESIPYHEHIIWCKYEQIVNKTKEVLNNYEYYYNKIFNNNLIEIFKEIKNNNKNNILKIK